MLTDATGKPTWSVEGCKVMSLYMGQQFSIAEQGSVKGQKGSWCSGITSASHAEGPGFDPQWVHYAIQ